MDLIFFILYYSMFEIVKNLFETQHISLHRYLLKFIIRYKIKY